MKIVCLYNFILYLIFWLQVSNQCMSLVKDNILVPTKDAPELAYVIESSEEKYVPDVFFMEMDKYKNEIKKIGRPLPVEYLLLDVTVSAPIEPLSTFSVLESGKKHFPVENRLLESSLQVRFIHLNVPFSQSQD